MAFQEKLQVEIETIFNSAGFDKLQAELKQTKAQMAATFGQVQQLRGLRREAERFAGVMEQAGLGEREGGGAPFFDMETGAPVDAANATERMADAMDRASVVSAGFSENVTEGAGALQEAQEMAQGMRLPFNQDNRRIADVVPQGNQDPMGMNRIRSMNMPQTRSLFGGSGITRFNLSLGRLSELSSISRIQLRKLGASAKNVGASMYDAAGGVRGLQMRLLGLQFTMMTIAFVFGGLMMSALGAVGVFKVLGNTLKFLFLPTALNVLGGVLGIQEAVMNMDKSTRKLIGNIFFWISAIAALVGLFAVLAKAILTVLGPVISLLQMIGDTESAIGGLKVVGGKLVSFFKVLGRWALRLAGILRTGLVYAWGLLQSAFSVVASSLATILAFLGGLVAAFLIVTTAAKKFGKKVALIIGAILIVIGALVAAVASTPVVIAAAIGVIIGAILGLIWTFKDTIISVFQGIVNAIVGFFEWLYNVLIGNSIIPKLIKGIINWFMKLPGMAVDVGIGMVKGIVKGLKSLSGAIWNAFKKILPDFVVNALEGAAGAVAGVAGGIANTVGNLAGGVANAAGNLASGVANTVGGFFGGGGNKAGTTNVQNNQINAQVQVNGPEETPQETGRKFGQGLAQGLNNKTSNISSGT